MKKIVTLFSFVFCFSVFSYTQEVIRTQVTWEIPSFAEKLFTLTKVTAKSNIVNRGFKLLSKDDLISLGYDIEGLENTIVGIGDNYTNCKIITDKTGAVVKVKVSGFQYINAKYMIDEYERAGYVLDEKKSRGNELFFNKLTDKYHYFAFIEFMIDPNKCMAITDFLRTDIAKSIQAKVQEEIADARETERQEAEERRVAQERTAKIGAINSRAKNAYGGGKTDNGSQSSGQANTYGSGNQGSPDGTLGANQYGLGGGAGKGISFSLAGRSARSLPKPTFPGNESGIVVVEVTIDKFGKVTKAIPGIKGSNTVNADLLEAAKKAAFAASFNTDQNAPAFQKGTITYHFIIQ